MNLKIIQYTLYSSTAVQLTCLLFIDFRLNFKNKEMNMFGIAEYRSSLIILNLIKPGFTCILLVLIFP